MGADKPGDIKYLTDLVKPNIGILTKISPVHVEFFGSIEAIAREKSILIKKLTADKIAILNFDDENVKNLADKTKAKVISYGYSEDCDVRVVGPDISIENGKVKGISFKLSYKGSTVPMFLPQVIGFHQLYAAMAGAAAGIALGMNMVDISQALKIYRAPKGRMQIIEGINDSLIIDDSYNSSPESAKEALRAASQIPCQGQRVAAFGDMLELGEMEKDLHQKLGEQAVKMGFEKIYAVGKFANFIRKGASLAGLSLKNIKVFENSKKAAQTIKNEISGGDVILVKGSQGARMERVTKALMANPQRASQLLVRQSKAWLKR
jgi:UDP-N-acetylmuramoyl-tripeptide--D-alanyl-D-alanine ligase